MGQEEKPTPEEAWKSIRKNFWSIVWSVVVLVILLSLLGVCDVCDGVI